MPTYQVERSITIDAPRSKVNSVLQDFREWPKWSPWLCMEPETNLNYFGSPGETGHGYEWEGEVIGAGKMELSSVSDTEQSMDLQFLRPFKAKADVKFECREQGGQTSVSWQMNGKMPFYLFFMIKPMKAYIGLDYERGLKMLKEYVETGTVNSKLEFAGVVDVAPMHYVGVQDRCKMSQLKDSMEKSMARLCEIASDDRIETVGTVGSVYNQVDLVNQDFDYTAMIPVAKPVQIEGATSGNIEGCKALKVIHTGSYEHLGNAWGMAMAHQRAKKLKFDKTQPAFELYVSDPEETAEADLVTEVYVPVRA